VIQEWNFAQPELTLVVLCIEMMITHSLKHNAQMPFMLFLVLQIDQDVINEEHANLSSSAINIEFIKYMK
jgi:hypothetical protein